MNSKTKLEVKFQHDILMMLEKGTANDVTIILKDGELKANKDVLVRRCSYFETILYNKNFVEGQTNCIKMKNYEKNTMKSVLQFLFTGNSGYSHSNDAAQTTL